MTNQEAKSILALYRPDGPERDNPEFQETLEKVRRDPELNAWFQQHCAFHSALREKFTQIPVPDDLRGRILMEGRAPRVQPVRWQRPILAWAAAIILLCGVATLLFRESSSRSGMNQFENYRARMVRAALREYRMDIVSNDRDGVRSFLATNGAPADYRIPKKLEQTKLTGAGLLRWRSNPVSMVCFDRGSNEMLFLFVVRYSAMDNPPPAAPEYSKVNKLMTASWTEGEHSYLLLGEVQQQEMQALTSDR